MGSAEAAQGSTGEQRILTLNGGSSSVKFAVFDRSRVAADGNIEASVRGALTGIGTDEAHFTARVASGKLLTDERASLPDQPAALQRLIAWTQSADAAPYMRELAAVGHRVVHGGATFQAPTRMDAHTLAALRALIPLAPNHLPNEIAAIEAMSAAWPGVPQIACFDTAFHATMPAVAKRFTLPRQYWDAGVRRYGFHGISYASICAQLWRLAGPTALDGRVIIAHLGSGASMVALRDGKSVDTTMGLTPLGGLVMSTRTGDLDPGVMVYLAREHGMLPDALETLVGEQSGLLGVSGVSADMRDLLAREQTDVRCAEAVESFCYAAHKTLGALVAVLGGLDLLVFTGGIGEQAAPIRQRIVDGLGYLGLALAPDRNASNAPIISTDESRVVVRVIPTDEEAMIARYVNAAL